GQVRNLNERLRAKEDAERAATKAAETLKGQVASLEAENAELAAQVREGSSSNGDTEGLKAQLAESEAKIKALQAQLAESEAK
ncbi:hypothetical protein T484DRAFT_1920843, partial [Baffinella frigidus]